MRLVLALLVLAGCSSGGVSVAHQDTGDTGDTGDPPDTSMYDGASLRIQEPASASFLPWGEAHTFRAQVWDAEGRELAWDEIGWTSSVDPSWSIEGHEVVDADLDVGLHDLTAETTLPNGDRLAHTVGGVLVQSPWSGTWVGLFTSDVTYEQYTVGCSGTATLVVEPYGEQVTGEADCVADVMGYNIEFHYLFDLANERGTLQGTASADIMGWFTYDFEATGSIDLESEEMTLEFGGDVAGYLGVEAEVRTDRISLDAGL